MKVGIYNWLSDFLNICLTGGMEVYSNGSGHVTKMATVPIYGKNLKNLPGRATENRFFAGPDRFSFCKTNSVCIKRIIFGPKKHTLRIIYWPYYLD